MKPIIFMNLFAPQATDEYFAQLNSVLLLQNSISQLVEKIKSFISYFSTNNAAQSAVRVANNIIDNIQNEKSSIATQSQSLFIDDAYRISIMTLTGQFAQINQLLRTIPYEEKYKTDKDMNSLLFLAQTAVCCGLIDIFLRIRKIVGDIEHFSDITDAVSVLAEKRIDPSQLESEFFAAKNWLHQQGIQILGVGFFACWIEDPFFMLNIYVNNDDPKFLSQTGIKLDKFLINFENQYDINIGDTGIDICGISELIEQ